MSAVVSTKVVIDVEAKGAQEAQAVIGGTTAAAKSAQKAFADLQKRAGERLQQRRRPHNREPAAGRLTHRELHPLTSRAGDAAGSADSGEQHHEP